MVIIDKQVFMIDKQVIMELVIFKKVMINIFKKVMINLVNYKNGMEIINMIIKNKIRMSL